MKDSMYSRILQGETTYKDANKFRVLVISFVLSLLGLGVLGFLLLGG